MDNTKKALGINIAYGLYIFLMIFSNHIYEVFLSSIFLYAGILIAIYYVLGQQEKMRKLLINKERA